MDEQYITQFSNRYNIQYEKVEEAASYINNLTNYMVKRKIEYNLIKLKEILSNVN